MKEVLASPPQQLKTLTTQCINVLCSNTIKKDVGLFQILFLVSKQKRNIIKDFCFYALHNVRDLDKKSHLHPSAHSLLEVGKWNIKKKKKTILFIHSWKPFSNITIYFLFFFVRSPFFCVSIKSL